MQFYAQCKMVIVSTFMNSDCDNFNYLHIQFSIPISIQVAPGSCHGARRKAKSWKALKLNDINNSEHAAVHAVYNMQCRYILCWSCLLLYYVNTYSQSCTISLCWWRIIILIYNTTYTYYFFIYTTLQIANYLLWYWIKGLRSFIWEVLV